MTSNQLQWASNQENERHNRASEEENNRHNEATEALSKEANNIADDRNRIEEAYRTRANEIQAAYNGWYQEYTQSMGEQKLEIEKQLANLQEAKIANENNYRDQMVGISAMETDIKSRMQEETLRHNKQVEQNDKLNIELTKQYQNKMLEYQKYQFNENMAYHSNALTQQINLLNFQQQQWRDQKELRTTELTVNTLKSIVDANMEAARLKLEANKTGITAFNAGANAALNLLKIAK